MGAQGSTQIQVNFSRPSLVYFAGEQITGNVLFQSTYEKLQVDEIFLEVVGELGYTTQEVRQKVNTINHTTPAIGTNINTANGNHTTPTIGTNINTINSNHTTESESYTANHEIPFLKIPISVLQPPPGQREIVITNGQYTWPFEFVLPARLPPTLVSTKSTHPYVKYYTHIVIHKSWYKPDAKQVYPFMIVPHVDLQQIPGSKQQVPFSGSNRKDVRLNGYVQRSAIVPSENLNVHINLQNPKQSTIKRIEAVLTQHRQIAQMRQEEVIFQVDVPELHESNPKNFERTVNLVIPNPFLVPSYQYMAQYNQASYPVVVTYDLELRLKSHGMFTDFEVKLPITIGTEQPKDPQQLNNFFHMPIASVAAPVYTEAPPSYQTTVANEKI